MKGKKIIPRFTELQLYFKAGICDKENIHYENDCFLFSAKKLKL